MLAPAAAAATTQEVAIEFHVSKSWVRRVKQEFRERGKTAPGATRRRAKAWEPHAEWILAKVAARPDVSLHELQAAAARELGGTACCMTFARALRALRLTRKTRRSSPPSGSVRTWRPSGATGGRANATSIPTGCCSWTRRGPRRTGLAPTAAAQGGRRCASARPALCERTPCGRWKTTTFLGALGSGGLVAPLCVEGAIHGRLFLSWVRQRLVPALRPGDVIVMDNLSSHKVKGVAEAIRGAKAEVRYLPPDSPDLNPIELAFRKFKTLLRDAAERTQDGLWRLCGQVLDLFDEHECHADFRHCGYRYS